MTVYIRRTERWLPIPGWEDLYEASSFGRVRGLDRVCFNGRGKYILRGRVLRPFMTTDSYWCVHLWKDNQQSKLRVGRLVCTVFRGPCPPDHECCHGPKGILDDSLPNVSWGTKIKNNGPDKVRDGKITRIRGEDHPGARLTATEVIEIRRLYDSELNMPRRTWTKQALADKYGVSFGCIKHIIERRSWAWL